MSRKHSNKNMMAQLHIAPKSLGIDDDTRRDFIAAHCAGKRSCAELTLSEQYKLLQAFKNAGWKPTKVQHKKNHYKLATSRKMIVLWRDLYALGAVRNQDAAAMEVWIAHQTNDRYQDLPLKRHPDTLDVQTSVDIIEKLKNWIDRIPATNE